MRLSEKLAEILADTTPKKSKKSKKETLVLTPGKLSPYDYIEPKRRKRLKVKEKNFSNINIIINNHFRNYCIA